MIRKEEIYARQLYQELQDKFFGRQNPISRFLGLTKTRESKSQIKISIEGVGVHWHCLVSKGARLCNIYCFDIDFTNMEYRGPEYYTGFEMNGRDIAQGRTFDRDKTIDAVKDWLNNKGIEELYSEFDFIDEKKRQLERVKTDIIKSSSKIFQILQKEVVGENFSSYSLWFKHDNRSCRVYYYGYEPDPRYLFSWDECLIFEISSSDTSRLGSLIGKWIVDRTMPSVLTGEFPEIKFDKLAEYYERGNGIEGEFIVSWDNIENFYKESELDGKDEILKLIRQMRSKGFEKTLRAGQSLYSLVLSRSRRHGLRENQNSISFLFNYINSAMEVRTQNGEILSFDKIEYNDAIERVLKTIEQDIID